MSHPMIELRGVAKTYPGATNPAVTGLDLTVEAGEIVALVGPSGCGKTTTLKLINRLVEPDRGTILVAGRDITTLPAPEVRRGIGYVIQQVGLFPHLTVAENIGTVPRLLGWDRRRIAARVDELVALVDLDPDMRDRYPAALSGGQRQRVGVARALAADPPVLLMDEPFGAVDPELRSRLQDELIRLQETLRKTILVVTHDVDEAIRLADRVAVLGPAGVLLQVDTPAAILRAPADASVEAFLGEGRGIRRLSLLRVADVALEPGPVVPRDGTAAAARDAMHRHGVNWVGIGDGPDLVGWAWDHEIVDPIGTVTPRPFAVRLLPSDTLRRALDAAITGHTRVAPVFDGAGRYLGMVSVESIARMVTA